MLLWLKDHKDLKDLKEPVVLAVDSLEFPSLEQMVSKHTDIHTDMSTPAGRCAPS